jgi:prepilin signal peptidase PulO-like enzyme (type II secretory pathway)
MLAAIGFVPGLAIGSFLNVVAARVPEHRSIVRPRSACGSCGATIASYDNIPVLSYAILRGKCRSCGVRIGIIYPAVELTAAGLIAACLVKFGLTPHALVAAFFCATLVTVSATDVLRRVIPNLIVLPAAGIVLVGMTLVEPSPQWAIGAVAASAFLLIAALAYPAGMGMGDVKLALLIGAGLGKATPVGLMIGMLSALAPSFYLLARYGKAARKMAIPFGPFLAFGAVVALFAGPAILHWWLSLGH